MRFDDVEGKIMEFSDFVDIITEVKKKKPILFGLGSDDVVSTEQIIYIEDYYNIEIPESYKLFLEKYGGGYFASIVVYSGDINSDFYIIRNVAKEWIDKNKFFPVIDFETGDLGGFNVHNQKCGDNICIFDHEENRIIQYDRYNFFQALLKYGLNISL